MTSRDPRRGDGRRQRVRGSAASALLVLALGACRSSTGPPPASGDFPTFRDAAAEMGVTFERDHGFDGVRYRVVETINGGVALLDFDQDGLLDIYITNGCKLDSGPNPPRDALYRQHPPGRFRDVAKAAGVDDPLLSLGVSAADVDGDGRVDLFVTNEGPNRLYRNAGDGKLVDVATAAGVAGEGMHSGSAFLDMDKDGDLDLYVASYVKEKGGDFPPLRVRGAPGYWPPRNYPAGDHHLYENDGAGKLADVSESSGIRRVDTPGRGLGVLAGDFNDDGNADLYVANDMTANYLFLGDGTGKFRESALLLGAALGEDGEELGSMGLDAADYDGDGRQDLCVTNYQDQINNLYHAAGELGFEDLARFSGISPGGLPDVSWGVGFVDFDNDGAVDLFIANGHLNPWTQAMDESTTYAQPKKLFRNLQDGRFEDVTARAGPAVQKPSVSRGAAFGDLDNDGDMDVVIANASGPPEILMSEGKPRGSWCLIELRGKGRNTSAIGARVTVSAAGRTQLREARSSASYLSANDPRLHFGLGPADRIDRIAVRWPDGSATDYRDLPVRKLLRIAQDRPQPEIADLRHP